MAQGALSTSESSGDYARIGEFATTITGTGETIYAHRMEVLVQQATHTVTRRAKPSVQSQAAGVTPTSSRQKQISKYAYVCLRNNTVTVVTTDDEAYVTTNFEYVL